MIDQPHTNDIGSDPMQSNIPTPTNREPTAQSYVSDGTQTDYNTLHINTDDTNTNTIMTPIDAQLPAMTPSTREQFSVYMQQCINTAQQWLVNLQYQYAQQCYIVQQQYNQRKQLNNDNNVKVEPSAAVCSSDISVADASVADTTSHTDMDSGSLHSSSGVRNRNKDDRGTIPCSHTCNAKQYTIDNNSNNDTFDIISISNNSYNESSTLPTSNICSFYFNDESNRNRHVDNVLHPYCHKQCAYHIELRQRVTHAKSEYNKRGKLKKHSVKQDRNTSKSIRTLINYPAILLDPSTQWYSTVQTRQRWDGISLKPNGIKVHNRGPRRCDTLQQQLDKHKLQLIEFDYIDQSNGNHLHYADSLYIAYLSCTNQHTTTDHIQHLRNQVADYIQCNQQYFELLINDSNCKIVRANNANSNKCGNDKVESNTNIIYGSYTFGSFNDYIQYIRTMHTYTGCIGEPEILALTRLQPVSLHIHELHQPIDKRYRCCNQINCGHALIHMLFNRYEQKYYALQINDTITNKQHDNRKRSIQSITSYRENSDAPSSLHEPNQYTESNQSNSTVSVGIDINHNYLQQLFTTSTHPPQSIATPTELQSYGLPPLSVPYNTADTTPHIRSDW